MCSVDAVDVHTTTARETLRKKLSTCGHSVFTQIHKACIARLSVGRWYSLDYIIETGNYDIHINTVKDSHSASTSKPQR